MDPPEGLALHAEVHAMSKMTKIEAPPTWTDLAEYDSLRLHGEIHRTRHQARLQILSGPGNTLVLSQHVSGYFTFRVQESGLEIPMSNVASAAPKGSQMAAKVRKTSPEGLTDRAKPLKPKTTGPTARGPRVRQRIEEGGRTVGPVEGVKSDAEDSDVEG